MKILVLLLKNKTLTFGSGNVNDTKKHGSGKVNNTKTSVADPYPGSGALLIWDPE
jgi:hypothetical protein